MKDPMAHSLSKVGLDAGKLGQKRILPTPTLSESLVLPPSMSPYPCPRMADYFISIPYKWVSFWHPEMWYKLRIKIRVLICQNLGRVSYTHQQWLSGGDEVSGESWQLVTAVHDRGEGGEGLIHCEWHLWGGSNGIFGHHFTSGFAGANTMVTFKHWCGFSLQSHRLYFVHMIQSTANCAEGHEASRILCWQCVDLARCTGVVLWPKKMISINTVWYVGFWSCLAGAKSFEGGVWQSED
jgi:hypothetical protein